MVEVPPKIPQCESERVYGDINSLIADLSSVDRANFLKSKGILASHFEIFDDSDYARYFESLTEIHDRIDALDDFYREEMDFALKEALCHVSREKIDAYRQWIDSLVFEGGVDPFVAAFFLKYCFNIGFDRSELRSGISSLYKKIIGFAPELEDSFSVKFRSWVSNLLLERTFAARRDAGFIQPKPNGQIHYLGHRYHVPSYNTFYRVYFSPSSIQAKKELCSRLHAHLLDSRSREVYFKESSHHRLDSVVMYIPPNDESVAVGFSVLDSFLSSGHAEALLKPHGLPTGVALISGVTVAAEPPLNDLVELFDASARVSTRVSFNFLMSFFFILSQALASSLRNDKCISAGEYFEQLLLLARVNPETMMPMDLRGGRLPHQAEDIRRRFGA